MEIQTFFLAKSVAKAGSGNEYNASLIGIHSFFPLDGLFSLSFKMPYYMLLRRAGRESDEEVTLRFNLIDMDGREIGQPRAVRVRGIFPSGHKFMTLVGTIDFVFPEIGDYRLDITADEEKVPSLFSYDIEITAPPS